jgi:hypothetical protein
MGVCKECNKYFPRLDAHQRASRVCGQASSDDEDHSSDSPMHCDDLELEQEGSSLEDERVPVNLERNGEHSVPSEGFVSFEHNAHECNGEHSVIDEFVNDDELLEEFIADCRLQHSECEHKKLSSICFHLFHCHTDPGR